MQKQAENGGRMDFSRFLNSFILDLVGSKKRQNFDFMK